MYRSEINAKVVIFLFKRACELERSKRLLLWRRKTLRDEKLALPCSYLFFFSPGMISVLLSCCSCFLCCPRESTSSPNKSPSRPYTHTDRQLVTLNSAICPLSETLLRYVVKQPKRRDTTTHFALWPLYLCLARYIDT